MDLVQEFSAWLVDSDTSAGQLVLLASGATALWWFRQSQRRPGARGGGDARPPVLDDLPEAQSHIDSETDSTRKAH